jgi:hypothetical protein
MGIFFLILPKAETGCPILISTPYETKQALPSFLHSPDGMWSSGKYYFPDLVWGIFLLIRLEIEKIAQALFHTNQMKTCDIRCFSSSLVEWMYQFLKRTSPNNRAYL